jgi:hypothetical protein
VVLSYDFTLMKATGSAIPLVLDVRRIAETYDRKSHSE